MKSFFSLIGPSINNAKNTLAIIAVAAASLLVATQSQAQLRIELPEMPEMRGSDMGVIMDGTMFSSGSNTSVSMTIENGVKKITAREDGVKTYIEESDAGIVVKVTRRYGPEQMDILMEEHPGLYMSMKDFPSEVEGAESIEVSVGVTKKYEAATADELKEKHPEVFKSYEKYSNGNSGGMQIFRGRFGDEMMLPEIRITPEFRRRLAPAPADLKIHEDEDKDSEKKESNKDDKDT